MMELFHFGSGTQAVHYFIWCFVATLGTLQGVATRYRRRDLAWFEGRGGYVFGALAFLGGPVWFFWVDEEAFYPGLAGAELFAVFIAAFLSAVYCTRFIAMLLPRMRAVTTQAPARASEKEPLL